MAVFLSSVGLVSVLISLWALGRAQRNLRWWVKQQALQLLAGADQIRNGVLQESFALRRSLELAPPPDMSPNADRESAWIGQLETWHRRLQRLSDQLSPAYVEDSLPLAIRSLVETWQQAHPHVACRFDLPSAWADSSASVSFNLIVLRLLEELLRSSATSATALHMALYSGRTLWGQRQQTLRLQITYPDADALSQGASPEQDRRLRQVFEWLTAGHGRRQRRGLTVTWHYHWPLSEDLPDNRADNGGQTPPSRNGETRS